MLRACQRIGTRLRLLREETLAVSEVALHGYTHRAAFGERGLKRLRARPFAGAEFLHPQGVPGSGDHKRALLARPIRGWRPTTYGRLLEHPLLCSGSGHG